MTAGCASSARATARAISSGRYSAEQRTLPFLEPVEDGLADWRRDLDETISTWRLSGLTPAEALVGLGAAPTGDWDLVSRLALQAALKLSFAEELALALAAEIEGDARPVGGAWPPESVRLGRRLLTRTFLHRRSSWSRQLGAPPWRYWFMDDYSPVAFETLGRLAAAGLLQGWRRDGRRYAPVLMADRIGLSERGLRWMSLAQPQPAAPYRPATVLGEVTSHA